MKICHRATGAILYSSETAASRKECVEQAVSEGANLADANLAGARNVPNSLPGPTALPEVPAIDIIHQRVLAAIEAPGCELDMDEWHTCATTHCRAGWVVVLAGERGRALEEAVGTDRAAALIYRASDPGFRVPHWYAPTARAMDDIRRCAERERETIGELC